MYNTEEIASRITQRIKLMEIKKGDMLSELQLGVNAISQLSNGHGMSYLKFAEIADKLDCSTDYLLGRTDNPTIYNQNNNSGFISTGDNSKQISNESGIVFQGNISGSPTINLAQPESTRSQLQNVIDHLLSEIEELKKIQKDVGF
ncbi:MAG: hypothetical protein IJ740_03340 [Ruminococcus sp.]|nr:hypothetical protein [Ruminococcus sp.]